MKEDKALFTVASTPREPVELKGRGLDFVFPEHWSRTRVNWLSRCICLTSNFCGPVVVQVLSTSAVSTESMNETTTPRSTTTQD